MPKLKEKKTQKNPKKTHLRSPPRPFYVLLHFVGDLANDILVQLLYADGHEIDVCCSWRGHHLAGEDLVHNHPLQVLQPAVRLGAREIQAVEILAVGEGGRYGQTIETTTETTEVATPVPWAPQSVRQQQLYSRNNGCKYVTVDCFLCSELATESSLHSGRTGHTPYKKTGH